MSLPTALNRASMAPVNSSEDVRMPPPSNRPHQYPAGPVPVPNQRENFIDMERKRMSLENNNPSTLIHVRRSSFLVVGFLCLNFFLFFFRKVDRIV